MKPFLSLSRTEQVQALEMVMGALRMAFYPPATRVIQDNLRTIDQALPLDLQTRRAELVALDAKAFDALFRETMNPLRSDTVPAELRLSPSFMAIAESVGKSIVGPMGGPIAAYGHARVDDRAPDPEHLQHFRNEGLAGLEAVFMARYFNNLLEFMGEPERSELEVAVLGPHSEAARRQRWMEEQMRPLRSEACEESWEDRMKRRRAAMQRRDPQYVPGFLRRPPG